MKIIQSDILAFVEAQAKDFRSTLNVTMMSVAFFIQTFLLFCLKVTSLPSNLPCYGPVRLFLK